MTKLKKHAGKTCQIQNERDTPEMIIVIILT